MYSPDNTCYINHNLAVYGGYIDDNEKLLQSASGGIATAMAEKIIAESGYVAGVAYDEKFEKAEYIIINDVAGINKLKGSKYVESCKNNVYKEVKLLLEQDEMVLFVGLPCEVAALKNIVEKEYDKLITCELICHGPTSQKVHSEYLQFLKRKHRSEIVDFSVRYKKKGWTPPYLRVVFENGSVFEKPFYATEYGIAFSILTRQACFNCPFKGTKCVGDIMIGDYWGAKKGDKCWNDNGVSVVFVRNKKGESFINDISNIRLFTADFNHAVRSNLNVVKKRLKPKNYDKFSEMFSKHGLLYAAKHSRTIKSRFVGFVIWLLPAPCINMLKKIRNSIKND